MITTQLFHSKCYILSYIILTKHVKIVGVKLGCVVEKSRVNLILTKELDFIISTPYREVYNT